MKQPIVDEGSNAAFDIVYSDAQGVKKARVELAGAPDSRTPRLLLELVGI
ncbi:hypothetical protein ACLK2I_13875 [Escherichia coli]